MPRRPKYHVPLNRPGEVVIGPDGRPYIPVPDFNALIRKRKRLWFIPEVRRNRRGMGVWGALGWFLFAFAVVAMFLFLIWFYFVLGFIWLVLWMWIVGLVYGAADRARRM